MRNNLKARSDNGKRNSRTKRPPVKATSRGKKKEKLAIVGGGISGLYLAWRILSDAPSAYDLTLYEADSRFGGRILSQEIPGIPFRAELGAMRFRNSQQILLALHNELDVKSRRFDVKDPIYYLRGRWLTSANLAGSPCDTCGAGTPFHLPIHEQGKPPTDLVRDAIFQIIKELNYTNEPPYGDVKQRVINELTSTGTIKSEDWGLVKKHGRVNRLPLFDIGFWNLLSHCLSHEAFSMVHDILSLDSVLGNWNAAEAIPWFLNDFADNKFLMFSDGTSSITEELEGQIKRLSKGRKTLRLNSPVASLALTREKKWKIELKNSESREVFDRVILALPQKALQRLKITGVKNQKWPCDWVKEVHSNRMFKLFLLYDRSWWSGDQHPGGTNGRIYTDLPLRQVFYFDAQWMLETKEADSRLTAKLKTEMESLGTTNWSLILASYSDEHHVSYWEPFLSDSLVETHGSPYLMLPDELDKEQRKKLERKIKEIPLKLRASDRMIHKVQQQLKVIHHGTDIPDPILGVFKDWEDGGWHTWRAGTQPWNKVDQLFNDYPNLDLCGEAYSSEQGWIEGALKSAEMLLQSLGVSKHEWKREGIPDLETYIKFHPERKDETKENSSTTNGR